MDVSVIMASYNGELFIKQQIDSIVKQLSSNDELIISDDGSTDNTLKIINYFTEKYENVKLVRGPCKGVAKNFENAFKYCKNDIVVFSDQDDIWRPEKIRNIKKSFDETNKNVLLHDAVFFDVSNPADYKYLFNERPPKHGVIPNILKNSFYGCCMAFKRDFLNKYIPFPKNIIAYDQYLGLCAEKEHTLFFLPKILIKHRYHKSNQSKKLTLLKKVNFRIVLTKQLLFRLK